MIILGLTGSIGTGKSTTADLFRAEGIAVNDADAVVHALYRGAAAPLIESAFPGTVVDGCVDRQKLSRQLAADPSRFPALEAIVHPLVRQAETDFVAERRAAGDRLIVLDIPLLFEAGGEARVDKILVVSCAPDLQRQRVLARPGMSVEKFELIVSRQMPDAEKRRRADFVIHTDHGIERATDDVRSVIDALMTSRD